MTPPLARIAARRDGRRVIVEIDGEIDLSNAGELEAELDRHVADADEVVVDLTGVEYLDSRGVWLLSRLARRLGGRDGALCLVAPPESIAAEVLRLARVTDLAPVRAGMPESSAGAGAIQGPAGATPPK